MLNKEIQDFLQSDTFLYALKQLVKQEVRDEVNFIRNELWDTVSEIKSTLNRVENTQKELHKANLLVKLDDLMEKLKKLND